MDTKTTLPISEARKKIFEIAENVQRPGTHYTFTEKGVPKAVLMSAEEFESWQETMEVMHEFPDIKKDMEEADRAIKTGAYKTWTTLENLLAREGFVLADKAKNKYEVSRNPKRKGRKAAK